MRTFVDDIKDFLTAQHAETLFVLKAIDKKVDALIKAQKDKPDKDGKK
jgi:hypothetical protein